MRFLPARKRTGLLALYTFWRLTMELAHEVRDSQVAALQLAWWRTQVEAALNGRTPDHPALKVLYSQAPDMAALAAPLRAMLDAVEFDMGQTRFLDQPALDRYSQLSGGAMFECIAILLGCTDAEAHLAVRSLGQAFAQTRMLRDLGHHLARGRLYLPLDALRASGVTVEELHQETATETLKSLLHTQATRIDANFERALGMLPRAQYHVVKPILMLVALQRTLLRALAAQELPVLQQRISLPPLLKLALAWRFQAFGRL